MSSHIDAEVQRRIEAAARQAEEKKRIRAEFAAARRAGIARRHAAKLRRLAQPIYDNTSLAPTGA